MFLQQPGFTIVAIAALALGIGTNTAIFSVVNTVLLKPLSFPDPERIVMFQNPFKQGGRSGGASPNEFNFWRQQTQAFQDVSAYAFNVANLTGEAAPEQIQTTRASADFFRLCGADVLRGQAALLAVGSKRQFITMAGMNAAQAGKPAIGHGCFTMESFNSDKVLKALADYGIKPRGDARGPAGPLVSYVSMRMENRGGAKEGTPELYFTDPDGVLMQIQDVSYCGGAGYLGEVCP
jgi:hypothetical protein